MKKILVSLLFATFIVGAQPQAPAQSASSPKGKPCSEMTADATKVEKNRCVKTDPCANLTADATRRSIHKCTVKKP